MKRTTVMALVIIGAVACVLSGCATTAQGPTDEEVVAKLTQECADTAMTKDIDKLMTYFSEKFTSYEYSDKADLASFLTSAKDSGMLDDLKIDVTSATTTIEKDTAIVEPVNISGGFGSASLTFHAAKEDGAWKISSLDIGY